MMRKDAGAVIASAAAMSMILTTGCLDGGGGSASGRVGDEVNASVRVNGVGVDLIDPLAEKGGFPIQVRGEGHTVTIDKDVPARLVVYPAGGADPVEFGEGPIKAEFRHQGRLLIVTVNSTEQGEVHYFFEPTRWSAMGVEEAPEEEPEEEPEED